MKTQLKVSIIQSHLHWENPVANRTQFSEKIAAISEDTDLIILPEMFTTGFTMNAASLAEETNGVTLFWMQSEAKKKNAALTGSIIIKDDGLFYNRLFFVFPDGTFHQYDKKHTFALAGEHKTYQAGQNKLIVTYKGWKICPLVCYDLRFPVWARNKEDYDLLVYVANWPDKRVNAWDALLKARAIENMAYCIGVNRVGLDGNGHQYTGHSAGYDVLGELLTTSDYEKEFTETITLEKEHVVTLRDRLQFLQDRDYFEIK
ncbi:amidohydrolase [Jejudonia soesokkakensis]|uniref:Amidohydrolase n=1 Tax=Jejudonia soesokkakensis TaxID=1323432 RepID=A0ABW2MN87_9FLAO